MYIKSIKMNINFQVVELMKEKKLLKHLKENLFEISIFNNVNVCNDFTILDIVNKTNNLKIC